MKIKDLVRTLDQFDPEMELVIDVDGEYVSPEVKRDIVAFRHKFNGVYYKDNAVVLFN